MQFSTKKKAKAPRILTVTGLALFHQAWVCKCSQFFGLVWLLSQTQSIKSLIIGLNTPEPPCPVYHPELEDKPLSQFSYKLIWPHEEKHLVLPHPNQYTSYSFSVFAVCATLTGIMYCSGGGNCLAYSEIQSSNSFVYTGGIATLVLLDMAVLISIITVCILFNLSVQSCSASFACSRAKLKHAFSNSVSKSTYQSTQCNLTVPQQLQWH